MTPSLPEILGLATRMAQLDSHPTCDASPKSRAPGPLISSSMSDFNLDEIMGGDRGDSAEGTDNYSRWHRLTHASSPRPPRVEER